MSTSKPNTPQPIVLAGIEIPVANQTPVLLALVAAIKRLEREKRKLRDEVVRHAAAQGETSAFLGAWFQAEL